MTVLQYVILPSKPGVFHTELGPETVEVERYDYMSHGRLRATFVIATLQQATRIAVVDDGDPPVINHVPSKLFRTYGSLAEARRDLRQLVRSESASAQLLRLEPGEPCR